MRNPITSLIKTAYKHAKGHRLTVLLYLALISTGASLWLLEPYIFGKLFNVLQVGGEPEEVLREVAFYLGAFASLSVLFWVFHGTGRVLERKTAFYITAKYQEEALESLFGRSIEWHRNNHSGKNIDKIRRGRDALYNFTQDTFELIEIFIAVFGSFVALFLIEPYVAAVAFFFSVVAILEVILFDRILFKQYKKLNSHYNKVSSAIHDYVTNIFTVLTMRFGNSAVKEYRKRQFAALPVFKKNIILNEVKWACMTFIITAMIFGVLGIEIYRMVMAEGVVMVGSLYMLYGYLDRISSKFY
ncbi:MAG: ABC transporter transmembrane domain-containing protein, partial [Patescibacteria group bacterium]